MELKIKQLREDTTVAIFTWLSNQVGQTDIVMDREHFDNPLKDYITFTNPRTKRVVKLRAKTYHYLVHFMDHTNENGYFHLELDYGRPVSEAAEIILKYLTSDLQPKQFKEWVKVLISTMD